MSKNTTNIIILFFSFLLMVLILVFFPAEAEVKKGLAILLFISILWVSEAFPISISALFIPVFAVIFGIFDVKDAFKSFAHPIIFLFLGGFALASALKKHDIDKIIAYKIVKLGNGDFKTASFLIMLTTYILSMWISNTSATLIMLPLALGLLSTYENIDLNNNGNDKDSNERNNLKNIYSFLLLGIAYSASIGGIATIIGSPPNAITSSSLNMGFLEWFEVGFPISLILMPVIYVILYLYFKPNVKNHNINLNNNFKYTNKTILTFIIFLSIAILWMVSGKIAKLIGVSSYMDSIIAVIGIILLFSLKLIDWKDLNESTDWGVLMLFGGALSLSSILSTTGTGEFIANILISFMNSIPISMFIFGIILFSMILTNIMSNTGVAGVLMPVLIAAAMELNISPELIALPVGIAVSCAYMLPVGTPPNAIVFAEGYLNEKDMIKVGFILSLISSVIIAGYFLLL
ncbi:SLC13 family permease [Methanothermococcus okinawensis]|uniref:Anion transporter n=1 Tax=Methanothermococcus okinawensis (strain DSM 14208 / JCM 11175 / IH1) TaxID=647113 RepID=F8ANE8_METOI|nr:DASS family sodium-coupled anion symporter [Methanothermococcus okinawensis]AEH06212.1 anion transporter [Methanothermococcus okinawensis IH1]